MEAIPQGRRSRRHYRENISQHNAKYCRGVSSRNHGTHRKSTYEHSAAAGSSGVLGSSTLARVTEADAKKVSTRKAIERQDERGRQAEELITEINQKGQEKEMVAKEVSERIADMEERIRQTPELIAGLGIYLDASMACGEDQRKQILTTRAKPDFWGKSL